MSIGAHQGAVVIVPGQAPGIHAKALVAIAVVPFGGHEPPLHDPSRTLLVEPLVQRRTGLDRAVSSLEADLLDEQRLTDLAGDRRLAIGASRSARGISGELVTSG